MWISLRENVYKTIKEAVKHTVTDLVQQSWLSVNYLNNFSWLSPLTANGVEKQQPLKEKYDRIKIIRKKSEKSFPKENLYIKVCKPLFINLELGRYLQTFLSVIFGKSMNFYRFFPPQIVFCFLIQFLPEL